MLARTCKIPGLLSQTWGSHSLASEGVINPDRGTLSQRERDMTLDAYAQKKLPGLLAVADPYFVDRGLVELVERMSGAVPDEARLHPRLFPSRYGCLFFEVPISMPPRRLQDVPDKPELPKYEPAPLSGFAWQVDPEGVVLVHFYSWAVDTATPSWFNGVYIGNIPLAVTPWSFSTATLGSHIKAHNAAIHHNPDEDDSNNAYRFALSARATVATLLLMDQTLTLCSKMPVDRPTRRRAEKGGWTNDPNVQVVTLRRVEYTRVEHEPNAVEWSCRWLVREHWRTLDRGLNTERTVFIPTYLKGPADKPIKTPSTRVFAVTR